jgi:hypothetical protein
VRRARPRLLANDYVTVLRSPEPQHLICTTPGIVALATGRLVAVGDAPGQSRHYASLAVSGEDLLVLSRSGDAGARNAHDCNLITLHRVRRFRDLA